MISTADAETHTPAGGLPSSGVGMTYLPLLGFVVTCAVPLAIAWYFLGGLFALVFHNDTYSHIPLIPVLSVVLVYIDRRSIFHRTSHGWAFGSALFFLGSACLAAMRLSLWRVGTENLPSVVVCAVILAWVGSFALFFGMSALRAAMFPLLFLLFAIPIPPQILSKAIFLLQSGSAAAADAIFQLFGVPHLRQGFVFALPGVTIRVAEECSGIRSTLALLIIAVLAGHLFLRTNWKKLILCLCVIPIAIFKNGLRIVTLSSLAVYVDPAFLHGNLHKYGGIPFFGIALIPLALLMTLFQRTDAKSQMPTPLP